MSRCGLKVTVCFTMSDHKHVYVAGSFDSTDPKNELDHISINGKPSKKRLFWIESQKLRSCDRNPIVGKRVQGDRNTESIICFVTFRPG